MIANLKAHMTRNTVIVVAALAGLVVGASLTYQLVDGKPTETASTERKVLYYRNPMGTGHMSDRPMKDEMGMDYIAVYADAPGAVAEAGVIRIDPAMAQNIGVRTAPVTKGNVANEITANGVLALNEANVGIVTARLNGYVEKLHVAAVGQKIRENQPLFDLHSPDLIGALEEYLSALRYQESLPPGGHQTLHRNATDMVVAAHKRLELLGLNRSQIRQVQAQGGVPRVMALHAVQSGIVLKKNVTEGGYITPGMELFTIADLSELWVLADVYAADFAAIRPGQTAIVQVQGLPGKTFRGKVDFIYPTLAAETRTAKVRIVLSNADGLLRPDMYASVTLQGAAQKAQLLVPKSAVLRTGKQDLVIIAAGESRFRPQPVRLGGETREHYAVLDGVKEGDSVVTSAQFLLDSESRIQEAVNKMRQDDVQAAAPAPPHEHPASDKPAATANDKPKQTGNDKAKAPAAAPAAPHNHGHHPHH